jgi:hypothetical protein
VGSLCDEVDRQDQHGHDPSPRAPPPVTSADVRGPVRWPVARRLSRREAARPPWEAGVHPPCPDRPIPTQTKKRTHLHQVGAPVVWQAPACATVPQQLRPKSALGMALLAAAMHHRVPLRLLVCDRWSRLFAIIEASV